ncbi:CLUMA_CG014893, isoform A [Clunio marinus]|uniref:CLUMA_CG014893, isoform A n=1 Tax=Clunio marinus TaxID=568069 RepID=A0A1J1IPN2_9DIPT|nr:CLUMA_CG014893, isoform A [Clunio marinus]
MIFIHKNVKLYVFASVPNFNTMISIPRCLFILTHLFLLLSAAANEDEHNLSTVTASLIDGHYDDRIIIDSVIDIKPAMIKHYLWHLITTQRNYMYANIPYGIIFNEFTLCVLAYFMVP